MVPLTVQPQHQQWMNASQNATPTSAMDERLTEQVKNVLKYMCSISCTATATGQNLSSKCLPCPHQQLGEMKSLCKVDSTCAQR